jgi:hypothetical protein
MEKNKVEMNVKLLFGIFSAGIILILPLRAYQYLKIIEPGTGFYSKTDFSVPLMYALLAVFCLAMFFLAMKNKKSTAYKNTAGKIPVLGVISFLVAVTLVADAVIQSGNFTELYYGTTQNSEIAMNGVAGGLMKSGALPLLFESIFAVLSALFFTVLGINYFTGKSDCSEYKLLAITPLAWAICRILHRFMRTISFIKVSDLFYELFMLVFLMLFFMAFAQLLARINHKGTDWKLFGFGLPAALLCLLCFVPRFAMLVMGKGSLLSDQSPPEYCDFAVALFILAFLMSKVNISKGKERG